MGNHGDEKKQQRLEQQQAEDRSLFLQSYKQANTPSPLQQAWEKANLDFINWEQGAGDYAGKPIDVMTAPGMGSSLSLYNHAKEGQQGERQGIGALRLGVNASDPGLAANLAEQSKLRREQDAAGQLENAVATKSAEAHGSALPLIQTELSRRMNLLGEAGGESRNSTGLWSQFRVRPGFLQNLANSAAQGAGQAAMFA